MSEPRTKDLEMVKRMNESVQQHQQKTNDLIRRAADLGFFKTGKDRSGRLVVKK